MESTSKTVREPKLDGTNNALQATTSVFMVRQLFTEYKSSLMHYGCILARVKPQFFLLDAM